MSPGRSSGPSRLATYFHVHLVSDSTGETLNAMAKAVVARFDGVIPIEHIYALVRSDRQMERVLEEIASAPGVVLHTLVDFVPWLEDEWLGLGDGPDRRSAPNEGEETPCRLAK